MIEKLEWDSDFFGHKIGKLEIKTIELPNDIEFKKFDLVYIFSNQKNINIGKLVDVKITFHKKIQKISTDKKIFKFNLRKHQYQELLDLTYQCGHDSRFLKDPFFGIQAFKKLYKTWIDKSIVDNKVEILVYAENNHVIGFVSFRKKETSTAIELIAVNDKARGLGIGSKLIDAVENQLELNSILTVLTQETNIVACEFYLKKGFKIIDKKYIYHYAPHTL